jgi:hypothetical protein
VFILMFIEYVLEVARHGGEGEGPVAASRPLVDESGPDRPGGPDEEMRGRCVGFGAPAFWLHLCRRAKVEDK